MLFDLSNSGVCVVFYSGATKQKDVLVSNPVPVPFRVEVLVGNGKSSKGNAVELINDAFRRWRGIIRELRVLEGDNPECVSLRQRLLANIE